MTNWVMLQCWLHFDHFSVAFSIQDIKHCHILLWLQIHKNSFGLDLSLLTVLDTERYQSSFKVRQSPLRWASFSLVSLYPLLFFHFLSLVKFRDKKIPDKNVFWQKWDRFNFVIYILGKLGFPTHLNGLLFCPLLISFHCINMMIQSLSHMITKWTGAIISVSEYIWTFNC